MELKSSLSGVLKWSLGQLVVSSSYVYWGVVNLPGDMGVATETTSCMFSSIFGEEI